MLQNFQKSIQIWDFEATNRKLFLQKQPVVLKILFSHLENRFSKFSFSSHIWRIYFQNSLSPLET